MWTASLLLLPLVWVGGQSSTLEERIDQMTTAMMSCLNVPGLSLAVVRKGDVLIQKGYGLLDVEEEDVPVTKDTLFPIASTTKAFTVTLLAMLLNQSSYDWDTPVRDILGPDFELYSPELTCHVTLRDMLSHRTGLPGNFVPLMAGYPKNMTLLQLLRTMKYHKPVAPLRTSFMYNNFLYGIAGYVAERLGRGSWEDLTRDFLFKPLGMTSSTFIKNSPYQNSLSFAQPHVLDNGQLKKVEPDTLHQVDMTSAAGAIVSSAADMARWIRFHLEHGKTQDGRQLLQPDELKETYKGEMPAPAPMNERDLWKPEFPITDVHTAYGMAWMTNIYRGYKRVWHSGGITTYKSQVWLYPHLDMGMYVAVNGPPTSGTTWGVLLLLQYITDLMLEEGTTPWLNASTICSFPSPWRPKKRGSDNGPLMDDPLPRDHGDYVGLYRHPAYEDAMIRLHNRSVAHGKPRLELRMGRFIRCLLHYSSSDAEFSCKLLGSLKYMAQDLPVRILSPGPTSGAVLEVLQMQLHSSAPWTNFTRGAAAREEERKDTNHGYDCHIVSQASTFPSFSLTMFLLPFLCLVEGSRLCYSVLNNL